MIESIPQELQPRAHEHFAGGTPPVNSSDYPNTSTESLDHEAGIMDFGTALYEEGTSNEQADIHQELIGVVSATEDSAVGLVRIIHGGKTVLGLSRLVKNTDKEGGRATLIGIVEAGQDLTVGRADLNDDEYVSRAHFNVSLSDEGELKISDTSTNGTKLVRFHEKDKVEDSTGFTGLKRFLGKKNTETDTDESSTVQISDFITDYNGWSMKSQKVADAISQDLPLEAEWDYTKKPEDLARLRRVLKGYEEPFVSNEGVEVPARYYNRDVIKRDSAINGGVYIVPGIQEAIVVDDGSMVKAQGESSKPQNTEYERAYNDFLSKARNKGTSVEHGVTQGQEITVLEAALESAMSKLDYNLESSDSIARDYADKKINLDVLLGDGKGVCRHQALLAGYYLERAVKDGHLKGDVSVDRNYIKGKGGHAWTRFTDEQGQVYIIDPAQEFVGTLEQSQTKAEWDYRRPEEASKI